MNARKLIELREKLAGVEAEFDVWLADAGTGGPLRKHQSQLRRLTAQLGAMAEGLRARVDALEDGDAGDLLRQTRDLQVRILEVHRLWDYFRSKLGLRYIAFFRDYLAIADEFAWACYGPVQAAADEEKAGAELRTAPLVFLSGDFSPYTIGRETGFEVERVPGAADSAQFHAFTKRLPIPVIGVPWYQVSHLPDAVLIGHEVGHDLEDDLDLGAPMLGHLEPVLSAMTPQRRAVWELWRGELFADLCGVLATGPAFVAALADLLATDPVQVAAEARQPSAYDAHPPAELRIAAAAQVLEELGFGQAAKDARAAWRGTFGSGLEQGLRTECSAVTSALLKGKYPQLGDRAVREVFSFSTGQQDDAIAVKDALDLGLAPATDDIRCLVAGARIAFEADPVRYAGPDGEPGAHERITARALDVIGDAPRGRYDDRAPDDGDADKRAGLDMLAELVAGTGGP